MEVKTFEIRDRATFIPALAILMRPGNEQDRYLFGRSGFGLSPTDQSGYVMLAKIYGGDGRMNCDPHEWGQNPRTMYIAHSYILNHWNELESGQVIDVEYALGETALPKKSESNEESIW